MYINKRLKFIIITVIVIFFLLTIAVFQFNQNKNEKYEQAKKELTQKTEKEIEDEYKLKTINLLQKINEEIPDTESQIKELEKRLETQRLKRRCLDYELERIVTNKGYTPWFCDKEENLEQFKLTSQKQTAQTEPKVETVVF